MFTVQSNKSLHGFSGLYIKYNTEMKSSTLKYQRQTLFKFRFATKIIVVKNIF